MRALLYIAAAIFSAWVGGALLLWALDEQIALLSSQLLEQVEARAGSLKVVAAGAGLILCVLPFALLLRLRRAEYVLQDLIADLLINPKKTARRILENEEALEMGKGQNKVREGWLITEASPFYYLYDRSTIREYYFLQERAQELEKIALKIRDEKFPAAARDDAFMHASIAILNVDVVLPNRLTEAEIKILKEMREKSFRRGWNIFPSLTPSGCMHLNFSKPSEAAVRLKEKEGISLHEAGRRMGRDFFRERKESDFITISRARNESENYEKPRSIKSTSSKK
ncbi:MAG: hypothetical protein ISN26_02300 [Betaproteobacteria bacterium AqS2]|uniref:Uncharacterized protein n=1 Tax=Candidatus Amphirhobacter heronislandensis TaxID=1732024 RepID=A0A930UBK2_9GAMM|nr:hypothetical protein [Betaproteobacteria bacterium AqS2]